MGPAWHGDPVIRNGLAYVTQPGTAQVECVKIETGQLAWRRTFNGLLALIESEQGVVVATTEVLACLDFESGKHNWHYSNTNISVANLHAAPSRKGANGSMIVLACDVPSRAGRVIPAVVWLDAASGIELHRSLLGNQDAEVSVFGAFVSHGERVWLPHARSKDKAMVLWELRSTPSPCARPKSESNFEFWAFHPNEQVSKSWKGVFPSWPLVSHRHDKKTTFHPEFHGEEGVVLTSLDKHFPTLIVREIELPKEPCKLLMRIGHDEAAWNLRVKVDKEVIHSQEIGADPTDAKWTTVEVDLSKYAGKRIWLSIKATSSKGAAYASWKQLALMR